MAANPPPALTVLDGIIASAMSTFMLAHKDATPWQPPSQCCGTSPLLRWCSPPKRMVSAGKRLLRSGNSQLCLVAIVVHWIIHLHEHGATPQTHWQRSGTQLVKNSSTSHPLISPNATALGASLGFLPKHVSTWSLRATSAMALLCGHVDTDIIRLLGRWRSDEMLRYLHLQAAPVMRDFLAIMLRNGTFMLHPNHKVPIY